MEDLFREIKTHLLETFPEVFTLTAPMMINGRMTGIYRSVDANPYRVVIRVNLLNPIYQRKLSIIDKYQSKFLQYLNDYIYQTFGHKIQLELDYNMY